MAAERELASVEWRVAAHSALGDGSRLRVVDAVGAGDVSPRDLVRALEMSSSLVAHHLKVLESAGLVRRTPSEADGRRTYVSLVPAAFAALGRTPGLPLPDRRVVFVCTGNSARSQLAAAAWTHRTGRRAASAGTHPATRIHAGARRVARRHGLVLLDDRPHSTDEVLRVDDMIVTVCDSADQQMARAHLHWSVRDPVRVGTQRAFEVALQDITRRIETWVGPELEGD